MGSHYQPMGHAQVVTNIVDYAMDVQAAIDAPRAFFVGERLRSAQGRLRVGVLGQPAATLAIS